MRMPMRFVSHADTVARNYRSIGAIVLVVTVRRRAPGRPTACGAPVGQARQPCAHADQGSPCQCSERTRGGRSRGSLSTRISRAEAESREASKHVSPARCRAARGRRTLPAQCPAELCEGCEHVSRPDARARWPSHARPANMSPSPTAARGPSPRAVEAAGRCSGLLPRASACERAAGRPRCWSPRELLPPREHRAGRGVGRRCCPGASAAGCCPRERELLLRASSRHRASELRETGVPDARLRWPANMSPGPTPERGGRIRPANMSPGPSRAAVARGRRTFSWLEARARSPRHLGFTGAEWVQRPGRRWSDRGSRMLSHPARRDPSWTRRAP